MKARALAIAVLLAASSPSLDAQPAPQLPIFTIQSDLYSLELLFHEAMHQWDVPVSTSLQAQARSINATVPRDLTHAMIFFTAGYAVQQVAPAYVSYADAFSVWPQRLSGSPLPAQRLEPCSKKFGASLIANRCQA